MGRFYYILYMCYRQASTIICSGSIMNRKRNKGGLCSR